MIRSPGSTRVARPFVPESAELKLSLLGLHLTWDHSSRSFFVVGEGNRSMGAVVNADFADSEEAWDRVLADLADRLVKARVPAGYTSGLSRIQPVKVEAASVIAEDFK